MGSSDCSESLSRVIIGFGEGLFLSLRRGLDTMTSSSLASTSSLCWEEETVTSGSLEELLSVDLPRFRELWLIVVAEVDGSGLITTEGADGLLYRTLARRSGLLLEGLSPFACEVTGEKASLDCLGLAFERGIETEIAVF